MTERDVILNELAQGLRPMAQGIEWFDTHGPQRDHPQDMPFNQPSPRCSSTTRRSSECRGPTPPQ